MCTIYESTWYLWEDSAVRRCRETGFRRISCLSSVDVALALVSCGNRGTMSILLDPFGKSRESILYHFPFRSSVHVHWNSHVTNANKNSKGRVCIKFGWLEGERCVTSFEKYTNYTNYIRDFLKNVEKKAACTIGIDWLTDCLPGCWVARLLGCLIPPFIGLCFLAGLIEWWLGKVAESLPGAGLPPPPADKPPYTRNRPQINLYT